MEVVASTGFDGLEAALAVLSKRSGVHGLLGKVGLGGGLKIYY